MFNKTPRKQLYKLRFIMSPAAIFYIIRSREAFFPIGVKRRRYLANGSTSFERYDVMVITVFYPVPFAMPVMQ